MDKKKQKQNQRRQARRGKIKRERKKKVLHQKHTTKSKKKIVSRKAPGLGSLPMGLKIKIHLYKIIGKLKRVGCFIGFHNWKICSGREGDPMYACVRCWKRSDTKWGKGGSKNYYDEKYEEKMGISDPKNWENQGNDWYFKGDFIEMNNEAKRRLKAILKRAKDKAIK